MASGNSLYLFKRLRASVADYFAPMVSQGAESDVSVRGGQGRNAVLRTKPPASRVSGGFVYFSHRRQQEYKETNSIINSLQHPYSTSDVIFSRGEKMVGVAPHATLLSCSERRPILIRQSKLLNVRQRKNLNMVLRSGTSILVSSIQLGTSE